MARYFRLEEAEAILPKLRESLQRAARVKTEVDKAESHLRSWRGNLNFAGGVLVDHSRLFDLRARLSDAQNRLNELVEEMQSTGCLVKDLEQGLIDFPALRKGEEVLLCWKLGEPEIAFWHRGDAGFPGRRPSGKELGLP